VRIEAISDAWTVIRENLGVWLGWALLFLVVYAACFAPYFVGMFSVLFNNPRADQFELQARFMPHYVVAILTTIFWTGVANAGLMRMGLRARRGEQLTFGMFFDWNRQGGKVAGFELIAALVGSLPGVVPVLLQNGMSGSDMVTKSLAMMGLQYGLYVIVGVALLFMTFVPLLIIDKGISVGEAIKESTGAAARNFWMLLAVLFLVSMLAGLGICALGVGMIFTYPFYWVTRAIIYDDLFGPDEAPRAPGDFSVPPPPTSL
jgi:hypothetical protein